LQTTNPAKCTGISRGPLGSPKGKEGARPLPKRPRCRLGPATASAAWRAAWPRRGRYEEDLQAHGPQRGAAARDGGDGGEGVAPHRGVACPRNGRRGEEGIVRAWGVEQVGG
jgi:hypothetical protein